MSAPRAAGPVCARCPAALGGSCCEVASDEQLATLTDADVRRIGEARFLRAERFVSSEVLPWEEAVTYEQRRPLYRGYFRSGPVRLALRASGGACVFLGERGCVLSSGVRPTACLLYPFDQLADGSWSLQVDRHGSLQAASESRGACLAVEEASRMSEVLAAFGQTRRSVEALGERLRAEVEAHGR